MIIITNNMAHLMIIFLSVSIWVSTYFAFKNTHEINTAKKIILALTTINAIISAYKLFGGF